MLARIVPALVLLTALMTLPCNHVALAASHPPLRPATRVVAAWPIVGIAATGNGQGYVIAAKDGGIFNFGNASFDGNTYTDGITGLSGPHPLNAPIVGGAAAPDGQGYWLVGADGGVFDFGDAAFYGSTYTYGITGLSGSHPLNAPIVGMAATPGGHGYWLVGADGGVFDFGSAPYQGSLGGQSIPNPIVAVAEAPDDTGIDLSNWNCGNLPVGAQSLLFVETNGWPFSFDWTGTPNPACQPANSTTGVSQDFEQALEIGGASTQPYVFLGDTSPSTQDPIPGNLVPDSYGCPGMTGLANEDVPLPGWANCQYATPSAMSATSLPPCQLYAQSSPNSCANPGPNFEDGWQQGIFAWDTALLNADPVGLGAVLHNTWWLDVEGSATWSSSGGGNYDAVLGAMAALEALGAPKVGIYSTTLQWETIVGGTVLDPASPPLPAGTPIWMAAPGESPGLVCADLGGVDYSAFGGGTITDVQYSQSPPYDLDAAC